MNIDFNKGGGLVPVIVQHAINMNVLMLGYMNEEALQKSIAENRVTFFSRTKNRLWTKGETSGNFLQIIELHSDCDNDSILISVIPAGPVCHTGNASCFNNSSSKGFMYDLEKTIGEKIDYNVEGSYSNALFKKGINKIAQKVGEEAVEVVIEAKDDNPKLFKEEVADLLYHLLVLLKVKKVELSAVESVLLERSK